MFQKITVALILTFVVAGVHDVRAVPSRNASESSLNEWIRGGRGTSPSVGLIDRSRLTVSHNLSFGASFGNGSSLMQSLYASRFSYRLSDPLTLGLTLGVQNLKYGSVPTAYNSLIGGFSLDYRPSKNIHLSFGLNSLPYGANPWAGWGFGNERYNPRDQRVVGANNTSVTEQTSP